MKRETLRLFANLMDKGYITAEQDKTLYDLSYDPDVSYELGIMEEELDFTLYRTNGRLYLLPNPTNELFSQDNRDFKLSVGSGERLKTLYLLNYLAMFLLYQFYGGKGNHIQVRDFIRESDFLEEFTRHCEKVCEEKEALKNASARYSIDFVSLAGLWIAKLGEDTNSTDSKKGCLNKILRKFRDEDLMYESNGVWKPTTKLNDLMPYFLSQKRISEIHNILGGDTKDAVNS